MTVTTSREDEARDAVIEALHSLVAIARRCPAIVARFAEDEPTAWDRRHEDIDALLDRIAPASDASSTPV